MVELLPCLKHIIYYLSVEIDLKKEIVLMEKRTPNYKKQSLIDLNYTSGEFMLFPRKLQYRWYICLEILKPCHPAKSFLFHLKVIFLFNLRYKKKISSLLLLFLFLTLLFSSKNILHKCVVRSIYLKTNSLQFIVFIKTFQFWRQVIQKENFYFLNVVIDSDRIERSINHFYFG